MAIPVEDRRRTYGRLGPEVIARQAVYLSCNGGRADAPCAQGVRRAADFDLKFSAAADGLATPDGRRTLVDGRLGTNDCARAYQRVGLSPWISTTRIGAVPAVGEVRPRAPIRFSPHSLG